MVETSVSLAGVTLRNPVIAAAGTCGYVDELADVMDLSTIGAVVTKSITAEPRDGNPPWRVIDVPGGMLNAVGLANVGLDRFVAEKLAAAAHAGTVVIGSIAGHSIDDYVQAAKAFDEAAELPAVELNVSCPNTDDGLVFGENPEAIGRLLREVRPVLTQTRMLVKLSPNVADIVAMAEAAIDAGADGLTLINTLTGMSVDVETRRPRLSRGRGGLSGPAVHPVAIRMVNDVYQGVARDAGVPIVGLGGVMGWREAAEFILVGATAVGIGTAIFVDPRTPARVARGLARWAERQGVSAISELIGAVDAT